jgi:hypothetical protein
MPPSTSPLTTAPYDSGEPYPGDRNFGFILNSYTGDAINGPPTGSVVADTCLIDVAGVIDAGDIDVTLTNEGLGDPLFVNDQDGPGTGDLHLQEGSPAVDAGVDAGVTVDFDGIARPSGAGFDLGAFELKQTALVITDVSYDTAANSLTITRNSKASKTYAVESSPDLDTWTEVTDGFPAGEGETTTLTVETPQRFHEK